MKENAYKKGVFIMKVEGLLGFLGAALGIGFSLMVLVIPDISQALEEESFSSIC